MDDAEHAYWLNLAVMGQPHPSGRAALSTRPEGGTRAEIRLPAGDAVPTEDLQPTQPIGAPS